MTHYADITVLGGLPVTVAFEIAPAEPDIGIPCAYVDDWWITHIGNRKVKKANWLYNRIASTKDEEDRIRQACWESE